MMINSTLLPHLSTPYQLNEIYMSIMEIKPVINPDNRDKPTSFEEIPLPSFATLSNHREIKSNTNKEEFILAKIELHDI